MLCRIDRENNLNFKDKELNSTVADRDALQGWVFIQTTFFDLQKLQSKNTPLKGDMRGMDKGYNDLQTRFYRLRTMIEDMRSNEQRLKGICRKYEERLISEQERYRSLLDSTKHQLKM